MRDQFESGGVYITTHHSLSESIADYNTSEQTFVPFYTTLGGQAKITLDIVIYGTPAFEVVELTQIMAEFWHIKT